MLAKRIIPSILHKNGKLVKGKQFINDRVIGVALQSARIYAQRSVDELLILDVSATAEGRDPNYFLVKSLAKDCFSPVTVGGGVRTEQHVHKLLRSGADKVCIGAGAKADFIQNLAAKYGSSTIVVSIDVEHISHSLTRKTVQFYESLGAGEILLQSVTNDGRMVGYDYALIQEVAGAVNIPVIASGGCGCYSDMSRAFLNGADAVAAGALFAFTDATPQGAAEFLRSDGFEVRL